jgi:hypothetical protein
MAQAERINTAIRELMSRGRPSKSTNPVRAAHTGLITALAANVPHVIHSDANCEVLEDRADHLQRVFGALHVYATAIIAETTQNIPGSTLDRRYLDDLFQQFDALGVIRNPAAEIREHENWMVS